jgi:hypothetical protein
MGVVARRALDRLHASNTDELRRDGSDAQRMFLLVPLVEFALDDGSMFIMNDLQPGPIGIAGALRDVRETLPQDPGLDT